MLRRPLILSVSPFDVADRSKNARTSATLSFREVRARVMSSLRAVGTPRVGESIRRA